ncbi:hypothetical protein ABB37_09494 [Leptomonas pyrrhocoris]|uniref:Uncharacterized protein n=1 Tax=Leptomonas pyrrhocoris TaxID=157538 RepID=A0A0M9FQ93_LEPPY|nr:hypothetical protein ABB37_09494 [Leptomonas pyrrhocoris]KPA73865.1 hypothetical protein ABB37_09494 [Leptomonas pyrrhocoris]|eukprot:XP_015652304.1 hypothetical protein ABB37_09494 [Leptomonas pyrrhocoris]
MQPNCATAARTLLIIDGQRSHHERSNAISEPNGRAQQRTFRNGALHLATNCPTVACVTSTLPQQPTPWLKRCPSPLSPTLARGLCYGVLSVASSTRLFLPPPPQAIVGGVYAGKTTSASFFFFSAHALSEAWRNVADCPC